MANVGAGVFQGMPVSTSLSASSLNESAGARTPVASLVTGGLVLATLIVLAPLFSELPKAVLAAIIIDAVVFGMIDIPELRRLYRVTRFDFWIAVAAILGVLSAGVLAGVVIGVVLSLGWLDLRRDAAPDAAARPRARHPGVPRPRREPRRRDVPGHRRAAARRRPVLRDRGGAREPDPRARRRDALRALVLDLEGVNFVDSQGVGEARRRSTSSSRRTASASGSRASSPRSWRCSTPTASSTGSAPTTSTATSTAPSRQSSTPLGLPLSAHARWTAGGIVSP